MKVYNKNRFIFKVRTIEKKVKPRIVIDDILRHGKPIINGTRVTVDAVLGALIGGMTYDEIESEYSIEREDIE
ncbi:hypothetical protein C5S31_02095 [ANME-1 cluster archaeon GoMg2]|nr:hypothetical protein [ANME-1 cluster archaeon GoMg2]